MSLNLFNLSTVKNSNAIGVEEGVHYKILKDGHGIEHKIINFENPEFCPREGIIELVPMRIARGVDGSIRHENSTAFKVVRDKELDVLIGIPLGIDSKTKNIIWQRITIAHEETLDLSIKEDAMKWACIRRSPFYTDFRNGREMNPNYQTVTKSAYKAVDREREAVTFEENRRIKRKATTIAETLVGADLEDMARNCGLNPNSMSKSVLYMEVIKFAEKEPKKFMDVYDSDTRVELSSLNRAIAMGVIVQTLDAGINYNGLTLGFNVPEALKYLRDHPQTLASIDALSRRQEFESNQVMKKEPVINDEKDAIIAKLQRELADKERLLKDTSEKALDLQTNNDLREIDPEFASLMEEGKRLGIKGIHLIKDKQKLKDKIESKRSLVKN